MSFSSIRSQSTQFVDSLSEDDFGQVVSYLENAADYLFDYNRLKDTTALRQIRILIEKYDYPRSYDSIVAVAHHKLGVLNYYLGRDDEAINHYQKAIEIRKTLSNINFRDIANGYRNVSRGYSFLKMHNEAKKSIEEALVFISKTEKKDSIVLTRIYRDYGEVLSILGDYEQAKPYFDLAEIGYQKHIKDDPLERATLYHEIFGLHKNLGEGLLMLKTAQKALNLFEHEDQPNDASLVQMAHGYSNLGLAYEILDSIDQSIIYYQKAISLSEKTGWFTADDKAKYYSNLALSYYRLDQHQDALSTINEVLNRYRPKINKILLGRLLENKADYLLANGQVDESLIVINQSLDSLVEKKLGDRIILNKRWYTLFIGTRLRIYHALFKKEKDMTLLANIEKDIQELISLSTELRSGYLSDVAKSDFSSNLKTRFGTAIDIYYSLYQQTRDMSYIQKAFGISEQSKTWTLLNAIKEASVKKSLNIPEDLLQRERSIKQEISELEISLFHDPSNVEVKSQLITLNRAFSSLLDTLRTSHRDYHHMVYADTTDVLERLSALSKESSLLSFFQGDSAIYCFVIHNQDIAIKKIPLLFPMKEWIKDLRKSLTYTYENHVRSDDIVDAYLDTFIIRSHALHNKLIKPIKDASNLHSRLIIIPDELMNYIPFESLISSLPELKYDHQNHDYLIQEHEINYSYSAAMLLEMMDKESRQNTNSLLAIAPSFNGEVSTDRSLSLSPLEHNISEATGVADLFNGRLISGPQASSTEFLKNCSEYDILHLATHAKANDMSGDYSFLAFTNTDGHLENSFIYNRDLYNLDLNAEMVVLSACETGIGELKTGEGIISLARGFSYAGAKSIVTTLWSINDAKTKELMESFYKHLKKGKSKSGALRQSKLDLIEKYKDKAHPYYWASFIAIGDMGPIEIGSEYYTLKRLGTLVAILGGLLLLIMYVKRRKTSKVNKII